MKAVSFLLASVVLVGRLCLAGEVAPIDFSKADWQLDAEGDGIRVYKWTPPDSDLFAFRADGMIDATVPKMVQILCDTTRRLEWAPTMSETYVLAWLNPVERIEFEMIKTPWIIKDRDFVIKGKAEFDGKGGVALRFHSIDDDQLDAKQRERIAKSERRNNPVRGEAYDSTYTLIPTPDRRRTNLEYRMLIDPKGSVPKWVVNIFQGPFPRNMILNLRKQVLKPGIPDYPMPPGSGWEQTANVAMPSK